MDSSSSSVHNGSIAASSTKEKSHKTHRKKSSLDFVEYDFPDEMMKSKSRPNSRPGSFIFKSGSSAIGEHNNNNSSDGGLRKDSFMSFHTELGESLSESLKVKKKKKHAKALFMLEENQRAADNLRGLLARSHSSMHRETEQVKSHLKTIKDPKTIAEEARKKEEAARKKEEAERKKIEAEERRVAEEKAAREAEERAAAEAEAKRAEELQKTAERLHECVHSPEVLLNNKHRLPPGQSAVELARRAAAEELQKREEAKRIIEEERQKDATMRFQSCSRTPQQLLGSRQRRPSDTADVPAGGNAKPTP